MGLFDGGIEVKTSEQLALMRRAGLVVGETLSLLREAARPGVTPRELDALAEASIRSRGATPSFLGYDGFPASICTSVNDVVVHGIPGDTPLAEGDAISIDCGAIVEGWHGDAAITVAVGSVRPEVTELMRVTEESMWRGIAATRVGGRIGDVSHAVESFVRSQGRFGIVEDYTGHGIGSEMHQSPDVPNYGRRGKGPRISAGMALAIEPMLTLGREDTDVRDDGWTVVTVDGSWAAHYEHTVAVTAEGLCVTTALDGGRASLERLGASYVSLD